MSVFGQIDTKKLKIESLCFPQWKCRINSTIYVVIPVSFLPCFSLAIACLTQLSVNSLYSCTWDISPVFVISHWWCEQYTSWNIWSCNKYEVFNTCFVFNFLNSEFHTKQPDDPNEILFEWCFILFTFFNSWKFNSNTACFQISTWDSPKFHLFPPYDVTESSSDTVWYVNHYYLACITLVALHVHVIRHLILKSALPSYWRSVKQCFNKEVVMETAVVYASPDGLPIFWKTTLVSDPGDGLGVAVFFCTGQPFKVRFLLNVKTLLLMKVCSNVH